MAYYLVRLYSGAGDRPVEDVIRGAVANELVPKLKEAGGLRRYVAGVVEGGGPVSASVYDDKEHADKGLEIARQWAVDTGAMKGYQLSQSFGGEIVRMIKGDTEGQVTHGVGRLWQTPSSAEQVADALEKRRAANPSSGNVRLLVLRLDDGRIATIGAFTSKEARDGHSEIVRRSRAEGEEMRTIFPNDPEEIRTLVLFEAEG